MHKFRLLIAMMFLSIGASAQISNFNAFGMQYKIVAGDTILMSNGGALGRLRIPTIFNSNQKWRGINTFTTNSINAGLAVNRTSTSNETAIDIQNNGVSQFRLGIPIGETDLYIINTLTLGTPAFKISRTTNIPSFPGLSINGIVKTTNSDGTLAIATAGTDYVAPSDLSSYALTNGSNATGTWPVSITGNSATVTNGVYTTGNQTIGGTKTFSSQIIAPNIRLTSGATNGYVLTSDASGNASWAPGASGGGVTSISGTANQVIASASTGAVTLSLPQSIGTGNSPTFGGLTLTGVLNGASSVFTGSVNTRDRFTMRRMSGSLDFTFARFYDGSANITTAPIGDKVAIGNAGGDDLVLFTNNTARQIIDINGNTTWSANGTFSGKLSWGNGSYVAGVPSLYNTSSSGTLLLPKTGSGTDFVLLNGIGQSVFEVPTGTQNSTWAGVATLGGMKVTAGANSGYVWTSDVNGLGSWQAPSGGGGVAGVSSFNGRTGAVSPVLGDYSSFYPSLSGSYSNPSWINSLAWSKITGTPTTLSGYGITDGITSSSASSTYVPYTGATSNINLNSRSIGWGGNTMAGAGNALIYSDQNYLVMNSKAGSRLYLNFDNTNSASLVDFFAGKATVDKDGKISGAKLQMTTGATNGYVLTSDASGNGTWAPYAGATPNLEQVLTSGNTALTQNMSVGGVYTQSFGAFSRVVGTNSNVSDNDYLILVDASSSNITITLPTGGLQNRVLNIKKIDSSANTVTITTGGVQTIDGSTSRVINMQWSNLQIQKAGTNWYIL